MKRREYTIEIESLVVDRAAQPKAIEAEILRNLQRAGVGDVLGNGETSGLIARDAGNAAARVIQSKQV